jgi:ATP-dependent Zn protease
LTWMSGPLENNKSKEVIVVGITNDPHKLDKALLQPGRFDVVLPFEMPSLKNRRIHIDKQLKKYNINASENRKHALAIQTENKTYTDIDNVISAVIEKSKELSIPIRDEFFEGALDFEVRKIACHQRDYCDQQRLSVAAYHAGQTLATYLISPERIIAKATTHPVKKTIQENKELKKYFNWGGTFSYSNRDDFDLGAEKEMLNECKVLIAGAEAQKIITGSYHYDHQSLDRQKAMDNYNKILLGGQEYKVFPSEHKNQVVTQSREKLDKLGVEVKALLEKHMDKLKELTNTLLEKEIMNQVELYEILES